MNEALISAFLTKIRKNYHDEDYEKIRMAAEYADQMHGDQKRKSGEPYIIHPLAVAETLAMQLNMDCDTVCAGLLHDVIGHFIHRRGSRGQVRQERLRACPGCDQDRCHQEPVQKRCRG